MTPDEEVALFKGALAEVGVLGGRDYESVYWSPHAGTDFEGVTIQDWKCDDVIVGRAFELLADAKGDTTQCCAACWAVDRYDDCDHR